MDISYEVLGYQSQSDFNNRISVSILEVIPDKETALKLGKHSLHKFEVVKVQSDDREFIEILTRKPKNPYLDSNWNDLTNKVEAMQPIILAAIKNDPDRFAQLVTDFYFHWKHNTFETAMMADFDESVKKLI